MSYLKLPSGVPDFSKAVFSLWFRVPRESVVAASSSSLPTQDENFLMMQSVLPLITFGRQQQNQNFQLIRADIVHGGPPGGQPVIVRPIGWSAHTPYDVDPSYIGLLCYEDGTFDLDFNIQLEEHGSYSYLLWFQTALNYQEEPGDVSPGTGYVGDGHYHSTIADGTYGIQDAQPEFFHVTTDIVFQPDQWHHVLLSFDVSGAVAMGADGPTSSCFLWYAIDDVDYRGPENMGPYRDEEDGLDPNAIVTRSMYNNSGFEPNNLFSNHFVPLPGGSLEFGTVPSGGGEIGLPAASDYVAGIFRVEMAELQIFTGVTLDTGIESSRRAFVDADGKPVKPTGTAAPAVALLGKRPEVLLHGSKHWQDGYNTGSLGADIEIATDGSETFKKLTSGQFTPVAGIEKFKPEPALDETPTT
jgi:hypothetical protein